jgi:hypothetical protein
VSESHKAHKEHSVILRVHRNSLWQGFQEVSGEVGHIESLPGHKRSSPEDLEEE